MKTADRLKAAHGANIRESMGAGADPGDGAGGAPLPGLLRGAADRFQGLSRIKGAVLIPVDRIVPDPDQPRKTFEEESLARLAASLKERGQIQPIRVRWSDDLSSWVVIAGERRYRASRLAGLATVACVESPGELSPEDVLADQLVENCLRDDLKPVEQARAFKELMARRGWSYRRLADHLHLSIASISRALSLLDLPDPVREDVDGGRLAVSTAHELARLDDPGEQLDLAARAVRGEVRREEIRDRASAATRDKPAGRPRTTRATFRLDGGATVVVTLDRPDAGPDAIAAALESALRRARGAADTAP